MQIGCVLKNQITCQKQAILDRDIALQVQLPSLLFILLAIIVSLIFSWVTEVLTEALWMSVDPYMR